jgi:hypothetical protein
VDGGVEVGGFLSHWRPSLGLVLQRWFEAQHDFIPDQDQVNPCLSLNPDDAFIPARINSLAPKMLFGSA